MILLLSLLTFQLLVRLSVLSQNEFMGALVPLLDAAAPLFLKLAPKSWKGAPMWLFAIGVSALLGVLELLVTGQLDHLNPGSASVVLLAFVGITQAIYNLGKQKFNLSDP